MNWTTDKPTEPGYYWAMLKLKRKFPYPIIIKYCESDTGGVDSPIKRIKEYYSMFNEKPDNINLYTHFMGPLDMPEFIIKEWSSLDKAAKANLNEVDLKEFFQYKQRLRYEGHEWEYDAEDILRGFIWDASEEKNES
jgi:hypothetical protein